MPLSAAAKAAIDRANARKENIGLGAELGAQETMEQSQLHHFFEVVQSLIHTFSKNQAFGFHTRDTIDQPLN